MSSQSDPACIAVDTDSVITVLCRMTAGALNHSLSFDEVVDLGPSDGLDPDFEYEGAAYMVRRALRSQEVDEPASARSRVRVAAAVASACEQGEPYAAALVTGMRMSSYFTGDGGVSDQVSAMEASLARPVGGRRGWVHASQIRVLPRTVCAFMDWAFDDDAQLIDVPPSIQRVLVVDVGHAAIALAAFNPASQEILPGTTSEVGFGWSVAADELALRVGEYHGAQAIPHAALLGAVIEGRYVYRGKSWSCADLLAAIVAPKSAEVAAWIGHVRGDLAASAVRIVVSGVGGRALGDALRTYGLDVHVPIAPEACNARGMLKFAVLAQREGL